MIYVSQRKPNKTLKNFFYNLSPKKEIRRVNTPQEAVDLLSKKVDSYVCVDLLTTNLDVQALNALMENSDNLLLLGLHSMRQKRRWAYLAEAEQTLHFLIRWNCSARGGTS